MLRTTFVSLAMLAVACAEGSASSSSAAPDFQATGGIVVASGNGSRFNAVEVRGVRVAVKQRSDGTWGGTIQSGGKSVPIDATFENGRFTGANIRMSIERANGQTTIVGSFQDKHRPLRGHRGGDPDSHSHQVRQLREARTTG